MHATSWSWVGFSAEGRHHAPVIHQSAELRNFSIESLTRKSTRSEAPSLSACKSTPVCKLIITGGWGGKHAAVRSRQHHLSPSRVGGKIITCAAANHSGGLSAEREERDWRGEPLLLHPHLLRLFLQWQIPETPLNLMNDKQVGVSQASGGQMQSIRSMFVQPNLKNNGIKPPTMRWHQWSNIICSVLIIYKTGHTGLHDLAPDPLCRWQL